MKNSVLLLALIGLILFGCSKDKVIDIPPCIENKIDEIKNVDVYDSPAEVWLWEVDGISYYYITSDCCDQYNLLYDRECNIVCAPDGGMTGGGSGDCPNFNGQIEKTLVWKDDR